MRRVLLLAWVLGCTPDDSGMVGETGDDGDDGDGGPSQHAHDDEECRHPAIPQCPPGFAYQFYSGAADDELVVIDLELEGEPVCNGHGRYVELESIEGADLVGVHITRNSSCTFGCFAGCTFTNICWTGGLDGRSCAHACTVPFIDQSGCTELVRECLRKDDTACP